MKNREYDHMPSKRSKIEAYRNEHDQPSKQDFEAIQQYRYNYKKRTHSDGFAGIPFIVLPTSYSGEDPMSQG
jgi:hypothetical protein